VQSYKTVPFLHTASAALCGVVLQHTLCVDWTRKA